MFIIILYLLLFLLIFIVIIIVVVVVFVVDGGQAVYLAYLLRRAQAVKPSFRDLPLDRLLYVGVVRGHQQRSLVQ